MRTGRDKSCNQCGVDDWYIFPNAPSGKSYPYCVPCHRKAERKYDLKSKYGITHEDYARMLEDQNGLCGICARTEILSHKTLAVDHDHKTGRVRGLLCHMCNRSLGQFGDDLVGLMRVIAYLSTSHD